MNVILLLQKLLDPPRLLIVALRYKYFNINKMGHPAAALADINRVVTVIDSSTFGKIKSDSIPT